LSSTCHDEKIVRSMIVDGNWCLLHAESLSCSPQRGCSGAMAGEAEKIIPWARLTFAKSL
jgi:hypothetical protein